jgi:hypothetical protein
MKARLISFAALLTFGCNPPAPIADAPVDVSLDDVGTDSPDDWPDAFAMDASVEGILCTGMPVPRGLPCEPQEPAVASGCGGVGRVVYERDIGCRPATGASCGSVRGAFNTLEECAMACGRLGRTPYSVRYLPGSGGKQEYRMGPLDFSPSCSGITVYHGVSPRGTSRCAHLGFVAPLYDGTESGIAVPASMSNQDVWELLNATELLRTDQTAGTQLLCATPR